MTDEECGDDPRPLAGDTRKRVKTIAPLPWGPSVRKKFDPDTGEPEEYIVYGTWNVGPTPSQVAQARRVCDTLSEDLRQRMVNGYFYGRNITGYLFNTYMNDANHFTSQIQLKVGVSFVSGIPPFVDIDPSTSKSTSLVATRSVAYGKDGRKRVSRGCGVGCCTGYDPAVALADQFPPNHPVNISKQGVEGSKRWDVKKVSEANKVINVLNRHALVHVWSGLIAFGACGMVRFRTDSSKLRSSHPAHCSDPGCPLVVLTKGLLVYTLVDECTELIPEQKERIKTLIAIDLFTDTDGAISPVPPMCVPGVAWSQSSQNFFVYALKCMGPDRIQKHDPELAEAAIAAANSTLIEGDKLKMVSAFDPGAPRKSANSRVKPLSTRNVPKVGKSRSFIGDNEDEEVFAAPHVIATESVSSKLKAKSPQPSVPAQSYHYDEYLYDYADDNPVPAIGVPRPSNQEEIEDEDHDDDIHKSDGGDETGDSDDDDRISQNEESSNDASCIPKLPAHLVGIYGASNQTEARNIRFLRKACEHLMAELRLPCEGVADELSLDDLRDVESNRLSLKFTLKQLILDVPRQIEVLKQISLRRSQIRAAPFEPMRTWHPQKEGFSLLEYLPKHRPGFNGEINSRPKFNVGNHQSSSMAYPTKT